MEHSGVTSVKEPPRLIVSERLSVGATVDVSGGDYHHLRHVMRLRVGAEVVVIDGAGVAYLGQISKFLPGKALVEILSNRLTTQAFPVSVGAAIIKGPRMDLLVEEATELGATELWPLACARSVATKVGIQRYERWKRLAIAAAKQCLAPQPMEVKPIARFEEFVEHARASELRVICQRGAPSLGTLLRERQARSVSVLCGPEGDFTPQEVEMALDAGFVPAGLGINRLRSETAVLAALSVIHDALEHRTGGES